MRYVETLGEGYQHLIALMVLRSICVPNMSFGKGKLLWCVIPRRTLRSGAKLRVPGYPDPAPQVKRPAPARFLRSAPSSRPSKRPDLPTSTGLPTKDSPQRGVLSRPTKKSPRSRRRRLAPPAFQSLVRLIHKDPLCPPQAAIQPSLGANRRRWTCGGWPVVSRTGQQSRSPS